MIDCQLFGYIILLFGYLVIGSHFVTHRKIFISHKLFSSTLLNKKHSVSHNFFEDETFSQITFERKVTLKK
jgi:branched-subunit amino acid permease